MPSAPGESRSHQIHQYLHDDLSVIQDPRYEFMTHAVQIYERGHRHDDNRKLVKVKAKKTLRPARSCQAPPPQPRPEERLEGGHDRGGGRP